MTEKTKIKKLKLPELMSQKYRSQTLELNMNWVRRSGINNGFKPSLDSPLEFKNIVLIEISNINSKDERVSEILKLVNQYSIRVIKLISNQVYVDSLSELEKNNVSLCSAMNLVCDIAK